MKGMSRFLLAAVFFVVCALVGGQTYGQGGATGAIDGFATDTTGAAVEGADVQVIDQRTEALARKVVTNADGEFVVTLLPPGLYSVVANKSGFAEAKTTGIAAPVRIRLKPGAVTEKVGISAQVTSVETSNATTGQTIGTETVRELPLATQN